MDVDSIKTICKGTQLEDDEGIVTKTIHDKVYKYVISKRKQGIRERHHRLSALHCTD